MFVPGLHVVPFHPACCTHQAFHLPQVRRVIFSLSQIQLPHWDIHLPSQHCDCPKNIKDTFLLVNWLSEIGIALAIPCKNGSEIIKLKIKLGTGDRKDRYNVFVKVVWFLLNTVPAALNCIWLFLWYRWHDTLTPSLCVMVWCHIPVEPFVPAGCPP